MTDAEYEAMHDKSVALIEKAISNYYDAHGLAEMRVLDVFIKNRVFAKTLAVSLYRLPEDIRREIADLVETQLSYQLERYVEALEVNDEAAMKAFKVSEQVIQQLEAIHEVEKHTVQ